MPTRLEINKKNGDAEVRSMSDVIKKTEDFLGGFVVHLEEKLDDAEKKIRDLELQLKMKNEEVEKMKLEMEERFMKVNEQNVMVLENEYKKKIQTLEDEHRETIKKNKEKFEVELVKINSSLKAYKKKELNVENEYEEIVWKLEEQLDAQENEHRGFRESVEDELTATVAKKNELKEALRNMNNDLDAKNVKRLEEKISEYKIENAKLKAENRKLSERTEKNREEMSRMQRDSQDADSYHRNKNEESKLKNKKNEEEFRKLKFELQIANMKKEKNIENRPKSTDSSMFRSTFHTPRSSSSQARSSSITQRTPMTWRRALTVAETSDYQLIKKYFMSRFFFNCKNGEERLPQCVQELSQDQATFGVGARLHVNVPRNAYLKLVEEQKRQIKLGLIVVSRTGCE